MIVHAVASPGEIRAVAVTQDGEVVDVAIERPGRPDGVGDRHRGRMVSRVPALAGSFVALVDGAEGFLPDSAAIPGLSDGDAVEVRITRASQGGKGPRLGNGIPAHGPPALLAHGPGAVERLAALHAGAPIHVEGVALHAGLRPTLGDRLHKAPFPSALEDALDALARPEAMLPGGVRASFHPTPALVAVDMDTAGATADRRGKDAGQFAANRAALPGLARHLRARNLSGAIVVDLAGLSPKRRAALGPDLAEALRPDPVGARLLGFTALGLAEIVRTRAHPPLHELLSGPHAAAFRAARSLAREILARPHAALTLHAAPDVHDALSGDREILAGLAHAAGRPPLFRRDPALPPGAWSVEEIARA